MPERRGVTGKIAEEQCAIVGANIRALCLRNGWSLWGSRTRPPVLTWASMRPVRTR